LISADLLDNHNPVSAIEFHPLFIVVKWSHVSINSKQFIGTLFNDILHIGTLK